MLQAGKPVGINAAVQAIDAQAHETSATQRQFELAVQQARYEVAHARRQYDAVNPANHLVAGELERRWNEALEAATKIERDIAAIEAKKSAALGTNEREQLMTLGADLSRAWSHPAATPATRKRILRACLNEIIVRRDDDLIKMVLHWQGGNLTPLQLKLKLNAADRDHSPVTGDLIALVRDLARLMPDRQIARLLNRLNKLMAMGIAWTEQRVHGFRKHHEVAAYRDGEWAERGEIKLEEAAEIIGVCTMTALRMLRRGDIKGQQVRTGAPWVIKAQDLAEFHRRAQPGSRLIRNGPTQPPEPGPAAAQPKSNVRKILDATCMRPPQHGQGVFSTDGSSVTGGLVNSGSTEGGVAPGSSRALAMACLRLPLAKNP